VFVAGGQQIYAMLMPYADLICLTEIDVYPAGDAFFPILPQRFVLTESINVSGEISHAFHTYASVSLDTGSQGKLLTRSTDSFD
jgi:dihydrofolate reductase